MTLGSHLLSLCALEEADHGKNLTEAQRWFRKALELVKKQEVVHEMLSKQTNDFTKKSRAIRRRLLLLRGRAHVNLGIALVEMSLIGPEHKGLEKEATTELESALCCSEAIRARAVTDDETPSETAMDRVEADQLDALANRWFGNSLWRHGRRKESVLAYKQSSRFFVDSRHNVAVSSDILVEAEIALGVECFYACTLLADFALDALEMLQVVQGHSRRQESLCQGEELFAIASDAYKRASLVSANIQTLANHGSSPVSVEDVLRENAILAPNEIEIHVKEISDWWDQKKQGIVLRPKEDGTTNHADSNVLRNDLFASGPSRPQHGNPKRYTVQEGSSRRKRRKQGGGGFTSTATRIHGNGDEVNESRPPKQRKYRKWGDELLPQVTTELGEMIPFGYPACAPPLPPGVIPFSFNR
jgi:hypothetical protein